MASLGGEVMTRSAGGMERACWDPEEPECGLAALKEVQLVVRLGLQEAGHERRLPERVGAYRSRMVVTGGLGVSAEVLDIGGGWREAAREAGALLPD